MTLICDFEAFHAACGAWIAWVRLASVASSKVDGPMRSDIFVRGLDDHNLSSLQNLGV